ncbi:MAG: Ig-like domain-containing protein [Planctomycetota bacterium]
MFPVRLHALPALLAGLLAAACGGGGPSLGGTSSVGTFREKPGGGSYFETSHQGGNASRLALVEITWGRLVDVFALDASGAVANEPVLRNYVINENVQDEPGTWHLEASPITQQFRLVILRRVDAPDDGRGSFSVLVRRAAEGLPGIRPKSDRPDESTPFSLVARNATLVLAFDDLLADDPARTAELAQEVRVLSGYPPSVPIEARLLFDPHHGGVAGGEFHSTRLLIDLTVSETEAADSSVALALNSLGLPRSERLASAPNVTLHLPTEVDPGAGQYSVFRNLAGRPLDAQANRPYDPDSPTRDVVRAMRAGNEDDPNNGFLLDFLAPRVVGTWPVSSSAPVRLDARGFEWELALEFASLCRKDPEPGDIFGLGERFLEVLENRQRLDPDGRTRIRARVLNAAPPGASELIGLGLYQSTYRAGLAVERGCWVRFTPAPSEYPVTGVAPEAIPTLRFSEPMDPLSARPFDTITIVRGTESTPIEPDTLVVGRMQSSLDLRDVSFLPSLPFTHARDGAVHSLRVLGQDGATDLSGNGLADALPTIEFTIDSRAPPTRGAGVVLRFDSPDELEPIGFPDLRGQFTYDLARGRIRPRAVVHASRTVDRSNPMVSIMPPFSPGVATPLSPLGSKLQTVWRYADLGWSIRDESKYNLDVLGLSWSPARGLVSSDFYERFEIRLSHSTQLPDEQRRAPITGGMKYPLSGLWEAPHPFTRNILEDPRSPVVVMNQRSQGYRVNPSELSYSASGTPLMPWPINRTGGERVSFTWRDTAVLARGGDYGVGVPLDSEVGVPLNLEDAIGSFAGPGQVPTVGLPLLMEFRCYPSETGIGLNPLAIALASNVSAAPNFRAFSTGGFNTTGERVTKDPDLELIPSGGFNPGSRPPGRPTARVADNALYFGQLDYVVRISRVHTIWIDTSSISTRFVPPVLEPDEGARPPGTSIEVEFRGALNFFEAGDRPFNAQALTPYGDPRVGSVQFLHDDPTWQRDLTRLDGARYIQARFTFAGNVDAALTPELSAIGIAYEAQ